RRGGEECVPGFFACGFGVAVEGFEEAGGAGPEGVVVEDLAGGGLGLRGGELGGEGVEGAGDGFGGHVAAAEAVSEDGHFGGEDGFVNHGWFLRSRCASRFVALSAARASGLPRALVSSLRGLSSGKTPVQPRLMLVRSI